MELLDHRTTGRKGSLLLRAVGTGLALLFAAVFMVKFFVERDVHEVSEEATQIFEELLINEFVLDDASLHEANASLEAAVEAAGRPGSLRFERWKGDDLPPAILTRERASHLTSMRADETKSFDVGSAVLFNPEARVTGKLTRIPLARTVEFVAQSFGCITGQQGKAIILIPIQDNARRTIGPLITRTLIYLPACGNAMFDVGTDLRPILEERGVEFYVGSEAMVLPNGRIRIRNTEEQLNRIGGFMKAGREPTAAQRFHVWSWETFRRVDNWLLSL